MRQFFTYLVFGIGYLVSPIIGAIVFRTIGEVTGLTEPIGSVGAAIFGEGFWLASNDEEAGETMFVVAGAIIGFVSFMLAYHSVEQHYETIEREKRSAEQDRLSKEAEREARQERKIEKLEQKIEELQYAIEVERENASYWEKAWKEQGREYMDDLEEMRKEREQGENE